MGMAKVALIFFLKKTKIKQNKKQLLLSFE